MKIRLLASVCFILLTSCNKTSTSEIWRINWGFEALEPNGEEIVYVSEADIHGDGERIIIYHYEKERMGKMKEGKQWIEVNEKNIETLTKEIEDFQQSVLQLREDEATEIAAAFKNHPILYETGDLYFQNQKEDGSYFIAILHLEEQLLYSLEWTQ